MNRLIFQRVINPETTLKRCNNLFQGFVSVLFQFSFMLCEPLKELETFSFIVALVFLHDSLFQVNYVSKQLPNESTDLSTAVECLKRLSAMMQKYRERSFTSALTSCCLRTRSAAQS